MRKAFELAHNAAYIYTKSNPFFLALDDISFIKGVEIGSILSFYSEIIFVSSSPSVSMMIKVDAIVIKPETGARDKTNTFYFTFACPGVSEIPQVIPSTYKEAMDYLEGKRKYERGKEHAMKMRSSLIRSY